MSALKLAGPIIARTFAVALFFFDLGMSAFAEDKRTAEAETKMAEGEKAYDLGQFEDAVTRWREARKSFARAKATDGEIRALLRQAEACQSLGQARLQKNALLEAFQLAEDSGNGRRATEIKADLGAKAIFAPEPARADADKAPKKETERLQGMTPEELLRESLKEARAARDTSLTAAILNNLGILLSAQGHTKEALAAFAEAADAGDAELAAKAEKNMADAALAAEDYAGAERHARRAAQAAGALPDAHEKAYLLMGSGQMLQEIFIESHEHKNALRAEALKLDQEAEQIAEKTGDLRALSYALGYEGALYEFEKRDADALALTRRAIFAAQQAHSRDSLYRWEWQAGRLLAKQGQRDAAIDAYRRAITMLQTIRNDIAIRRGNRNAHSSFRETVGEVYFGLADLLLQRADGLKDEEEVQTALREARDTAELLKAAELEDYFQDNCVSLLKSKTKRVESISPTSAVIYIIPLANRTELLVSLPNEKMKRFTVGVGDEELTATVRQFRLNLEDRATDAFLEQGQKLYAWLIKPLEPLMASGRLNTMVFIPDGALRTIPMAALHDGQNFLIEKYAVAVTPGLELMEAGPVAHVTPHVMIRGLSQAQEGFPALQHVPQEVEAVEKVYQTDPKINEAMNEKFQHKAMGDKLREESFTIVHIASHGKITDDVRKSFVLTFDKHLTLDDLEEFIRPAQLRDQPLELLTLSACQTAAGDDRAALGLAGVAVKAGARSAFATLWFVNDQASTELVGDFYTELTTHDQFSKAQALQAAQKKLLSNPRYAHPCYWAPYLIIGNWL